MTRALVTGGVGFVGRHLVDALIRRGDAVTTFDVVDPTRQPDARHIKGDLRDREAVSEAVAGHDVVFHPASLVHTRNNRVGDVFDVNVGGTDHVIAACRAHEVPRLVYLSSASAVYEGVDLREGDETLPYARTSQAPYADSKIAAEKRVLAATDEALATVAIRPHVVFGPEDQRFIPAIVAKAKQGRLRFSVGRGDKLSDFTYISNLVDALLAADSLLEPESQIAGQAYFVTNGEPMGFWDFVSRLLARLDYPPILFGIPYPLAYAAAAAAEGIDTLRGGTLNTENGLSRFAIRYMCTHHYFSIDKAKRDLDWMPRVSIDEGLERTADWVRQSIG